MPAARHAARSSGWALAVSASMRVGRLARLRLGGADAAGGFQAVHARHLHVHQHQIVRRAGGARGGPGFDRRFAVAGDGRAMAEPRQQRARKQRVDLVVLGHQDRQAFAVPASARLAAGRFPAGMSSKARFGGEPRGERGRAHRLDQIAGEAAPPSARAIRAARSAGSARCGARRRARRDRRRRSWRRPADSRPAARPSAAPASSARGAFVIGGAGVARPSGRAGAPAAKLRSRRAATISTDLPARSGAANSARARPRAGGKRQRDAEGGAGARLRFPPRYAPSMRSTMRLEMASPRPVPPNLRVEEPSACSKSRKMRA